MKGSWGGRRLKAGRRRKKSEGVAHIARHSFKPSTPLHINMKFTIHVRNEAGLQAFIKSVDNARRYISIIHYSIESNHLHLIIEAHNNEMLEKGMRSFTNTFCKLMRKGPIQKERYHLHVLKTPMEARNAFHYVLLNHVHHTGKKDLKADLFNSLHLLDPKGLQKRWG